MGLCMDILKLPWILITGMVPLFFGIFMLIKAIASDLSAASTESCNPAVDPVEGEVLSNQRRKIYELPPVVLVHGVFGFGEGKMGHVSYFGGAEKKYERVFVPDLGSLTSIHDRARQLFYYLKGGQVDYGEEHSKACGHSRFGRVYKQGKYPEWDEDHPIHFVGHSAGAQTVRVLHQMLADKAFRGYENTSENWVLSLTAICGAFNGSTRSYITGMKPENWKSIKAISPIQLCRLSMIFSDWMDISWLKSYYSFGFDHFNMSWRKVGLKGLFNCLMGKAGPFASGDWVLPDLTIQGSMEINQKLKTFPNTFYFSYATKRTRKINGVTTPAPIREINPWFYIQISEMCRWRYPTDVPLPYEGYRDEDWQDNDGELNTISMTHPHLPTEHPHSFVANDSELLLQPQPGIWYYKIIEAIHIQFVLNLDKAAVYDEVYDSIFECCRKLSKNKSSSL
ncbi:hypothetical protein RHGRI_021208 [Rhododendron griersonianum]|uniref:Lipase-like C-terminal domain-containing protein n=1 Tax=Rhododendron griersonianum TaxID=479676 RepID=A0AAV6JNA9_9ERIC|nr:hypothetical protein RHGRI_021208 [Rhododendron griersonianum]